MSEFAGGPPPPLPLGESDRQAQFEPRAKVLDADSFLRAARTLATKELGVNDDLVKEWYARVLLDEMSIDAYFDSIMGEVEAASDGPGHVHDYPSRAIGVLWILRRAAGGGRL